MEQLLYPPPVEGYWVTAGPMWGTRSRLLHLRWDSRPQIPSTGRLPAWKLEKLPYLVLTTRGGEEVQEEERVDDDGG